MGMRSERLTPDELADLVARAAAGEARTFARLVEQYEPLVRATARRYGAGADTDDLVQEAWLRLLLHLDRLREPAALPAWLCQTVRNLCFTRGRRLSRVQLTPLEPDTSVEAASTLCGDADPCADEVVAADAAAQVQRAVERLSPRDRRLARHVMEQSAYGEISADLAMPVGSIGPTRERMLRRLGAAVEIRHLVDAA
jgi:RNA polymerase sigma factor (sigma-70 family)